MARTTEQLGISSLDSDFHVWVGSAAEHVAPVADPVPAASLVGRDRRLPGDSRDQ